MHLHKIEIVLLIVESTNFFSNFSSKMQNVRAKQQS